METIKSYNIEALVEGTWSPNRLFFTTKEDAESYALGLLLRWTGCSNTRVVESDEPANYRLADGKLERIEP